MDKVAVLIPCYNEAQTIEKVVKDYKAVLPEAIIYVMIIILQTEQMLLQKTQVQWFDMNINREKATLLEGCSGR